MSYTDSPAAKLLASHCACCARPLVDAVSIESGVGPVCREKHGYFEAQGPADWTAATAALGATVTADEIVSWQMDARRACNALVYRVAVEQCGPSVRAYVAAIEALGFTTMAARILDRLDPKRGGQSAVDDGPKPPAIRIVKRDDVLVLTSPYAPLAVEALRKVPGRRWDGSSNTFPAASLDALVWALRVGYPGQDAVMPDGATATLRAIDPGEAPPVAPAPPVTVTDLGHEITVAAPYSPEATALFRGISGRRWDSLRRVWCFPRGRMYDVRTAIATGYPVVAVSWPEGLFPSKPDVASLEEQFGIEIDPQYA